LKFFIDDFEDIIMIIDQLISSIYIDAEKEGLSISFPRQEVEIIKP